MALPWPPPLHATVCPWSGRTYTIAHGEIRGKEHPALYIIEPANETLASIDKGPVLT